MCQAERYEVATVNRRGGRVAYYVAETDGFVRQCISPLFRSEVEAREAMRAIQSEEEGENDV